MIAILSTHGDRSTDDVIAWLDSYGADFVRINDNDLIDGKLLIDLSIENKNSFTIKDKRTNRNINFDDINIFWFRKFGFYNNSNLKKEITPYITSKINGHLIGEYFTILDFFESFSSDKKWLCSPKFAQPNKLFVLNKAVECGLKIPETRVICNKKEVLKLISNQKYITKSLNNGENFIIDGKIYNHFTELLSPEKVKNLPTNFFPSYVQKYIDKEFEIRIFYLDNKCYSMAIFSQNDEQTKIDFRKYNTEKPNRCVPYLLPKKIEKKIKILMCNLGLNTGSIDIIKSTANEFVFLEVNPVGQFKALSEMCNYNLENKIANYLLTHDKK